MLIKKRKIQSGLAWILISRIFRGLDVKILISKKEYAAKNFISYLINLDDELLFSDRSFFVLLS